MNTWPKVKLGDLCEIVAGSTPDSKNSQYWNGDINWVTPAEMKGDSIFIEETERKITRTGFDSCSTKLFPKGAVILSTRAPIGKVAIAATEMCSNQGIKSLMPRPEKLDSFYLYWWLKDHADYLNSLGSGATFKELSMTVLKSVQIPVPPIDIQKKIVTILNACHDLKKLRQEADQKMETFAPALFHQMFGDPARNERGWRKERLGDLCEILNGYAFKSERYVDSGIRVIRITNVQKGFIVDNEPKFYPKNTVEPVQRYELHEGDLLISLTGNVGRVGLLQRELLPAALNQRVACIRIIKPSILIQYLFVLLNGSIFESECINASSGVAQKNLSTTWISNYQIPVPPIELQESFVELLKNTYVIQEKQSSQRKRLVSTYDSLIQDLM